MTLWSPATCGRLVVAADRSCISAGRLAGKEEAIRMAPTHDLSERPIDLKISDDIELARGYFDTIANVHGEPLIGGWMLLPDKEFDSLRVYWNEKMAGLADVESRQDVAEAYPWIPHASRSGFSFRWPKAIAGTTGSGRIDLLGCQSGRPIGRLSTLFRTDLDAAIPAPPEELLSRIGACGSAPYFRLGGLKLFGDLMEPIQRHREISSIRRLLDWGCGCGRVTAHFLLEPRITEVFGCDVDPEAVQWCITHLSPGRFSCIEPWPPTGYEDAAFDVAVGISVFTHLGKELQDAWLTEMRRIIAPGGLLLASTHGEFAARFAFPKRLARLLRGGIFSDIHNPSLDGIVPEGCYRDVYQVREYTLREWSRYFEILEYIERGMGNHQDLVVMRRPGVSR